MKQIQGVINSWQVVECGRARGYSQTSDTRANTKETFLEAEEPEDKIGGRAEKAN